MRVFVDTNVFLASITDEEATGDIATALLDSDHDLITSLLNLMEIRTVLTKKERLELERAVEIQREITADMDVVIHDASDMVDADGVQRETLLYPLDALVMAAANAQDATLTTFDTELIESGAVHPEDLL